MCRMYIYVFPLSCSMRSDRHRAVTNVRFVEWNICVDGACFEPVDPVRGIRTDEKGRGRISSWLDAVRYFVACLLTYLPILKTPGFSTTSRCVSAQWCGILSLRCPGEGPCYNSHLSSPSRTNNFEEEVKEHR